MAAGKHDRTVIGRAKAGDDAIGARAHIGWLLAVRAPVAKQEPARALAKDFAALASLVVAIVPFDQVGVDLGGVAEASERARAGRPLQWLERTGEPADVADRGGVHIGHGGSEEHVTGVHGTGHHAPDGSGSYRG